MATATETTTSTQRRYAPATSLHEDDRAHDEEERMFALYARTRDPRILERLVERFMPLAKNLAGRYSGGVEPYDDLLQVASVGLVNAITRFDPDRGFTFATFAVPTILGEVRRHFRDRGWSIRVPRDLQERNLEVENALSELPTRLGRSPSVPEIAEHLGMRTRRCWRRWRPAPPTTPARSRRSRATATRTTAAPSPTCSARTSRASRRSSTAPRSRP